MNLLHPEEAHRSGGLRHVYYNLQGHRIPPADIKDLLSLLGKTEEQCEAFFLPFNWTKKGFAWNWLVSTTTMLKWTERGL